MGDSATIQFLGAVRCVTGSKFLLRTRDSATLVDCGLFQGLKDLRRQNWVELPFPPRQIGRIILTHAHIDHTGYLPRLRKEGFDGPIFCTRSTAELLGLLLPDCGHLQEEEAKFAAKKGFSKHNPPLPLYTADEAREVLPLLRPVPFDKRIAISDDLAFRYRPAGHILGAANIEFEVNSARLLFSGDLGRYADAIMNPPRNGFDADYVLMESTYGDRLHPDTDVRDELAAVINRTAERGGVIVIPAFAVGRTQTILYHIRRLEDASRIPRLPVIIDSPMAVDASALYCKFGNEENLRLDLTMTDKHCCPLRCNETRFVRTVEESMQINSVRTPAIIISASGMAAGGRVVHHLAQRLPDKRNTILLVGYQAAGTRGRALHEGAKHLKIHGQNVLVKAEIVSIAGLSAHGDQRDLMRWLSEIQRPPRGLFLVHGEDDALTALQQQITEHLHWPTHVPKLQETIDLA